MTRPGTVAPHVQAAIRRGAGQAAPDPAARSAPGTSPPHRTAPQRTMAPHPPPPARPGTANPAPGPPRPRPAAPHVQAVLQPKARADLRHRPGDDFVTYGDLKSPGAPPPPPRFPVYALHCTDGGCSVTDVKTGRSREAGTLFGGFVRMNKGGPIYVSPRPSVEVRGDSHPTIAAASPPGQAGHRELVAAGEVGIVDNRLVGHNDKTGHYRTRKNLRQSGLPPELFHPFTEDPGDWFGDR